MSLYLAIPKTSHEVTVVATSAAIKTLLQVATPSTTDIRVIAWGCGFKGVSPTAVPGEVTLVDVDVAATSLTALTPEEWGSDDNPASLCVSGTSATGYGAGAEGTIGGSRILDGQIVHPQTGYAVWFPERFRPRVKASRFLRIRSEFAADINSLPWILWEEPA
jgi:hypothetical protein